jgi:23S rRNA pseudouridine2457 synthase
MANLSAKVKNPCAVAQNLPPRPVPGALHPPSSILAALVCRWLPSSLPSIIRPLLIAFHKPFGVLSQFTGDGSKNRALAVFGFPKDVWPIGRLDADSEGLLLLSDEPDLNQKLLHPRLAHEREYWVQVERIPSAEQLKKLERGVMIQGRKTLPCRARMPEPQPVVPPREPPIRFRKSVPDCWIALELVEGKNRQVRRMTAAIGHPTLRLLRVRIGNFWLGDLKPGQWKILSCGEYEEVLNHG